MKKLDRVGKSSVLKFFSSELLGGHWVETGELQVTITVMGGKKLVTITVIMRVKLS